MSRALPNHLLIVDDDSSLRLLLRNLLEPEGYVIHEAAGGSEALAILDQLKINLITLDLNLRGEDGLALARALRKKFTIPFIMVTAKSDDIDRIVGLEVGADDYIVKPFNLREVLARIRAVLRRCQQTADFVELGNNTVRFGNWELNTSTRMLNSFNGVVTSLTTAEFNLLEVMARRPARVMTRDAIMELLKGRDAAPFDRSIDTLIGRLRKKIEPDSSNPTFIKTVHGAGYLFAP